MCRCLGGQNGTKTRRSHSDLTKSRACGALFLFSEQGGGRPLGGGGRGCTHREIKNARPGLRGDPLPGPRIQRGVGRLDGADDPRLPAATLQTVGALPPRVWACRRHSQCQCGCLKRTESDSGEQCGPPAHAASEGAGLRPALKVAVLDGAGRSAAHTFYFNTLYLNTSIPQYTSTGGVKVAASSRNGGKRQRRLTLRLTLRRRTDRQQRPLRLQLRRRRQEPGRGQRREERRQGRPDAWRRRHELVHQ